jgi:hypothetical protein
MESFLHVLKNQLLRQRYARVHVENSMERPASSLETIHDV